MKILKYILFILIIGLSVSGCSTPYFGHTKEEWDKLSEKEKTEVKKEYGTVLETRDNQANTDKINKRTQSIIDLGSSQTTQ